MFGSEFIAMKAAINQIKALHYKLQMIGVPLDGEMNGFCHNESVFKNSTLPESTMKKKHNSIAYHHTHEAQAANIVFIAWEKSKMDCPHVSLVGGCPPTEFVIAELHAKHVLA